MTIIKESGMAFRVDDDSTYRIEQSTFVQRLHGGKVVEFIAYAGNETVTLTEAKQSSPRPDSENKADWDTFMAEITEKFINSILLYNAILTGRHPSEKANLPLPLQKCNLAKAKYKMTLVIRGHKAEWLAPLADALRPKFNAFFKCWNIAPSAFSILNDEMAREKHLID